MFDWEHMPAKEGDKIVALAMDANSLNDDGEGNTPDYHPINVYAHLWIYLRYDDAHHNRTRTRLQINLERFWDRPYLRISAAQNSYLFYDLSIKEADDKLREMMHHFRSCPEVDESNGERRAKCSHYQEYEDRR